MFSLLYAWATTVACICVLAVLVALVRAMSQAPRATRPLRASRRKATLALAMLLVIAFAGLISMPGQASAATAAADESSETIDISKDWSWTGHRPRQEGELVAMGKTALEQEAARKVAEWNSAPGPVKYELVAVQFERNDPVHKSYRRNKLTGERTSSASGTAIGKMIVRFTIRR